jgi:type IV pilus assembly protein PilW
MVNNCATGSVTNTAIWVPVADSIVSMRVEYALDTNLADRQGENSLLFRHSLSTYGQATPSSSASLNEWQSLLGVRLVLVGRNEQFEKEIVTTAAPTWFGSTSVPPTPINLSNEPNWQHYRYRTFQTVIPSRNLTSNQ